MSVTIMPGIESDSLIAPPNFIKRAANRIIQELSADAEDWANIAGPLRMYP
jgi:predicted component of type VI protein secretion system